MTFFVLNFKPQKRLLQHTAFINDTMDNGWNNARCSGGRNDHGYFRSAAWFAMNIESVIQSVIQLDPVVHVPNAAAAALSGQQPRRLRGSHAHPVIADDKFHAPSTRLTPM